MYGSEIHEKNTKYTRTAMALHWLMMLLILTLIGLGWYMADLPKGEQRSAFFALHKSIGLTVFLLALLRLSWRLSHPPPRLPASLEPWRRRFAGVIHFAMYCCMFLQPMSGYLSSSFSGYATRYFGVPLPQWGWEDKFLNELFSSIHQASALTLCSLITIHVLAALSHALPGQEPVLRRTLPW
ncbi:MAG: cytochrome b [Gammaproteobacteria bacterium]